MPIILKRGTPAAVVAKLGELEATLDLPTAGCWPHRTRPGGPGKFGLKIKLRPIAFTSGKLVFITSRPTELMEEAARDVRNG